MFRGDIYFANLGDNGIGSEQNGNRPVVIIQNNVGNRYSPTVVVAMVSTCLHKAKYPTHVVLEKGETGLGEPSVVLCEQIRTIDKSRLSKRLGSLNDEKMEVLNEAIGISIGLHSKP